MQNSELVKVFSYSIGPAGLGGLFLLFLINIFAVTDAIDSNRAAFSIDFIDNSIITNPKTIAGYRTFEFFASGRKGGFPSGSGLQP